MFSCKQLETFPKDELIDSELVQSSYMNVGQVLLSYELDNQSIRAHKLTIQSTLFREKASKHSINLTGLTNIFIS